MSSDTFKIGDICEWQNLKGDFATHNGMECVVIGSLQWCTGRTSSGVLFSAFAYPVQDSLGKWQAEPFELRNKKPKPPEREQCGEWELCPWQPSSETVTPKP